MSDLNYYAGYIYDDKGKAEFGIWHKASAVSGLKVENTILKEELKKAIETISSIEDGLCNCNSCDIFLSKILNISVDLEKALRDFGYVEKETCPSCGSISRKIKHFVLEKADGQVANFKICQNEWHDMGGVV